MLFYLYGYNRLEFYILILKCILIRSIIIVTVCVFQVISFIVHLTQSPLHPHWHYNEKMKYGQCSDSVLCITTALVKITTWMNHQTEMQTDTWIKIGQLKWHLLHSLLKHPVIWYLRYHSVYPSWIFLFPVRSLEEISSLQFSDHNK